MEEMFSPVKSIGLYIKKVKDVFRKYKLEKGSYRYSLVNVISRDDEIELHIILVGIKKQFLNKGETIFTVKDINTNELFKIYAKKLYQDYNLLIRLCKKDIITVISSAVQEQTFLDIKTMGML